MKSIAQKVLSVEHIQICDQIFQKHEIDVNLYLRTSLLTNVLTNVLTYERPL